MDNKPSESPVRETTNEARQGPLGRPVLNVLIVALLLALVAWGAAELYGERVDNVPGNTGTSGENAPPPAPSTNQPVTNTPVDRDPTPQTGSGGDTQTKNPAPAN
ncbi:hypothetical protein [Phyllobacterium bourgognense]|uniref:Uncharacterized protein n=1 Tax=Phyllobacterium bourgognense TaxID=314236 RepID=A0A368Z664_9HYPH|nr:hypothetical protein [Phyllobacterium bourgognense]RCW87940.1 hypothetical protein C7476_101709 [Phyllobacterium bourgognense]